MRTILLSAIFIFSMMNSAWAMKCWQRPGIEGYKDAERVFLIYVTQTRLDDVLWRKMNKGYPAEKDSEESVKAVFVDYVIKEEFKGDTEYKPILIDLLGVGTGYLGAVPGVYYLVMLGKSSEEDKGAHLLNTCNTRISHYRLNVKPFQDKLDIYRAFRDSEKK